ncbi:MAG: TIGR00725 family protein [Methanocellales archaeon]|nr:TIGR00725 family protein [Methanocellales archaeon]
MQIAVIGSEEASEELKCTAKEVGRLIAKSGAALLCGGLGGVMEYAALGAREAGGQTVGILPGVNRREANPYIDIAIATGMDHARNVILVRSSDAVIAVGGGYGTLSEIALALKMKKPVVAIKGGWEIDGVMVARDATEAVRLAIERIKSL